MEESKATKRHPHLQVHPDGTVTSGGIVCEPTPNKNGYMMVEDMLVHMAVARLYVQGELFGLWVKHLDGDITNNCHENLEWILHPPKRVKVKQRRYRYMFDGQVFETAQAGADYMNAKHGYDITSQAISAAANMGYRCKGYEVTRELRKA